MSCRARMMSLRNKRVLITAGPTWVPIDDVRVISNVASGETGIILANEAKKCGAKVTLVLGPVDAYLGKSTIRIERFKFFQELKDKLTKLLRTQKYDILIHSAAVADYQLKKVTKGKISSNKKELTLKLIPTQKLIGLFKKIDSSLFVVAFKFEIASSKGRLIRNALSLLRPGAANLVVANTVYNKHYCGYIVNKDSVLGPFLSKKILARKLLKILGECQ